MQKSMSLTHEPASEPLHISVHQFDKFAYDRRGNNSNILKDIYLEAKTIIWPWLSYMSHIRSIATPHGA